MIYESSVGFVLIKKEKPLKFLLMYRNDNKIWDFPKGHLNKMESAKHAALRELEEETGIKDVEIINNFKEEFTFINPKGSNRKIILFLGKTEKEPNLSDEHKEFKWCSFEEAYNLVKFKEKKILLKRVIEFIEEEKLLSS